MSEICIKCNLKFISHSLKVSINSNGWFKLYVDIVIQMKLIHSNVRAEVNEYFI